MLTILIHKLGGDGRPTGEIAQMPVRPGWGDDIPYDRYIMEVILVTKLYIQLDWEKTEILENGYCETCLAPARHWIEPDRFGNFDAFPAEDHAGNVCGFLCPDCAAKSVRDKG